MCIYTLILKKRVCICIVCVYMVCVYTNMYAHVTCTYLRIFIDLYVLGTAKARDLYQWNGTADIATRSKVADNTETCNCESSWLAQREDPMQAPCAQEAARGKPATRPGKLQENQKNQKIKKKNKQYARTPATEHQI